MSNSKRSFYTKRDVVIIAVLFLFAGGWLLVKNLSAAPQSAVKAEIYYRSSVVKTVELTPGLNETFAVPGQPGVVLQVSDGKIRFYSSTCRDKICIRSGFLSRPGESAACLPNQVAVKLVAAGTGQSGQPDTYIS